MSKMCSNFETEPTSSPANRFGEVTARAKSATPWAALGMTVLLWSHIASADQQIDHVPVESVVAPEMVIEPASTRQREVRRALLSSSDLSESRIKRSRLSADERDALNRELREIIGDVYKDRTQRAPLR